MKQQNHEKLNSRKLPFSLLIQKKISKPKIVKNRKKGVLKCQRSPHNHQDQDSNLRRLVNARNTLFLQGKVNLTIRLKMNKIQLKSRMKVQ